jgi:hypothetical protein
VLHIARSSSCRPAPEWAPGPILRGGRLEPACHEQVVGVSLLFANHPAPPPFDDKAIPLVEVDRRGVAGVDEELDAPHDAARAGPRHHRLHEPPADALAAQLACDRHPEQRHVRERAPLVAAAVDLADDAVALDRDEVARVGLGGVGGEELTLLVRGPTKLVRLERSVAAGLAQQPPQIDEQRLGVGGHGFANVDLHRRWSDEYIRARLRRLEKSA